MGRPTLPPGGNSAHRLGGGPYHRNLEKCVCALCSSRTIKPSASGHGEDYSFTDTTTDKPVSQQEVLKQSEVIIDGSDLQPTSKHLPVVEFVPPGKFAEYKQVAERMCFVHVASGPLVRSSYHADEFALPPAGPTPW